jgi:hypothetical protein
MKRTAERATVEIVGVPKSRLPECASSRAVRSGRRRSLKLTSNYGKLTVHSASCGVTTSLHLHNRPFENPSLDPSSFSPLQRRGEDHSYARGEPVFFLSLQARSLPIFHRLPRPSSYLPNGLLPFLFSLAILLCYDPILLSLPRKSKNMSSIATSRPTRSTRATTSASSSGKTTMTTTTKPRAGAPAQKNGVGTMKKRGKGKGKEQVFCVCRGRDYGTPMICCGACREW